MWYWQKHCLRTVIWTQSTNHKKCWLHRERWVIENAQVESFDGLQLSVSKSYQWSLRQMITNVESLKFWGRFKHLIFRCIWNLQYYLADPSCTTHFQLFPMLRCKATMAMRPAASMHCWFSLSWPVVTRAHKVAANVISAEVSHMHVPQRVTFRVKCSEERSI